MYAFIQDVPGTAAVYARINDAMELGAEPVPGLVAHVVIQRPDGLRYVNVWHHADDWLRFRDTTLLPAVEQVLGELGIPHDMSQVRFEEVHVIDAVTGSHPHSALA